MSTGAVVGLVVAAVVVVLLVGAVLVVRHRRRGAAPAAARPVGTTGPVAAPGAAGRRRSDAVEGADPGTTGTHRGADPLAADPRQTPPQTPPPARPTGSSRPTHRA